MFEEIPRLPKRARGLRLRQLLLGQFAVGGGLALAFVGGSVAVATTALTVGSSRSEIVAHPAVRMSTSSADRQTSDAVARPASAPFVSSTSLWQAPHPAPPTVAVAPSAPAQGPESQLVPPPRGPSSHGAPSHSAPSRPAPGGGVSAPVVARPTTVAPPSSVTTGVPTSNAPVAPVAGSPTSTAPVSASPSSGSPTPTAPGSSSGSGAPTTSTVPTTAPVSSAPRFGPAPVASGSNSATVGASASKPSGTPTPSGP